ncbi:hypothetical protein [Tersicoccus sp. Bi-70]|uniref:hypothetical protein n=1 Tax=Tersicoccus sp. Bi-70 TaxID=1897634 RepID=UPI000976CAE6|nr:hypothetical protein [Tersicoccus sp. Bi-70]OMH36180.1 hypothetical protein BGP79_15915 [Tersicoccus sp. Bi-70]
MTIRRWVTLIAVVVVMAVLGAVLWVPALDVRVGQAMTAVATAVGAIGTVGAAIVTAVAAFAARDAARESGITAQKAVEALALAKEPSMGYEVATGFDSEANVPIVPGDWIKIGNSGRWAALDVELWVAPAGQPGRSIHFERIGPGETQEVPVRWKTEPVEPLVSGRTRTDELKIRYSDEQRALRWEIDWSWHYTELPSEGTPGIWNMPGQPRLISSPRQP